MKVVASIQARMGSSRLPGKVLMDVGGKPMLLRQIERVRRSSLIESIVVATSEAKLDDSIAAMCDEENIECFRGPEADVLQRLSLLITERLPHVHVELFGDSPLVDPNIVDHFISYFLANINDVDYVSSALETSYPPGLEVTVFNSKTLLSVNKLIGGGDPLREHAGFNITRFKEKYRIHSLTAPPKYYAPEIYLEVDEISDFKVIQKIFEYFDNVGVSEFGLEDILEFVSEHKCDLENNQRIERRWKVFRDDKKV